MKKNDFSRNSTSENYYTLDDYRQDLGVSLTEINFYIENIKVKINMEGLLSHL